MQALFLLVLACVAVCIPRVYADSQDDSFFFHDPHYKDQWHLQNFGQVGGIDNLYDIHVTPVWRQGITGKGITVGIMDSLVESTHPDLAHNIDFSLYADFNNGCPVTSWQAHSTAVAGLIGAMADNDVCGSGVAPNVRLANVRLVDCFVPDVTEATAFKWKIDMIDVYSCNFGPRDDGRHLDGPGPETVAAMAEAVKSGRGGRGTVYVWSAGNGNLYQDNCNYDGYANSPYTIAVGAISAFGTYAEFSEPCAAMLVVAPGGNYTPPGITTTDLTSGGYGKTDCTNQFAGTNSAAPQVAGIVALMLEANPNLGWRDVQEVLLSTARPIELGDSEWSKNRAGRYFHPHYGFGLVDAAAAVEVARTWKALPSQLLVDSGILIPEYEAIIPQIGASEYTYDVLDSNLMVERVQVMIWTDHPSWGDIVLNITSPFGTTSVLATLHAQGPSTRDLESEFIRPSTSQGVDNRASTNDIQYKGWPFMSVQFWGEPAEGRWTLSIGDDSHDTNVGTFQKWRITLHTRSVNRPSKPEPTSRPTPSPIAPTPESVQVVLLERSIASRVLSILTKTAFLVMVSVAIALLVWKFGSPTLNRVMRDMRRRQVEPIRIPMDDL